MTIHLNGWRRIALAMTVLWICIAIATTGLDYFNKSDVGERQRAEQGNSNFRGKPVPADDLPDELKKPQERDWSKHASVQEEIEFSVRREKEEGKTPIPVQMPNGTIVDMPNKLSPELASRLKELLNDPNAAASLAPKDQAVKQAGENKGFDLATAREVKPWGGYLSKQDGIPKASEIHWPRFLLFGLVFPVLLWISAELLALVVRWIIRGFRESKPRPNA